MEAGGVIENGVARPGVGDGRDAEFESGAIVTVKCDASPILPDSERRRPPYPRLAPVRSPPNVTEQLVFELAVPEPPSFGNFLAGRNAEALSAVKAVALEDAAETGVFLWGASGAGKTHLLRAAVGAAEALGGSATFVADPGALLAQDPESLAARKMVAIDGIDQATPDAQARLFTLFNRLRDRGGHLVAASRVPLTGLAVREDLRTRLGWGLAFEIVPLADAEKPAALAAYARQRGFRLTDDVIGYLLAHGRRDMAALLATLSALDRHSLATKRPITIPMLRDWWQREIGLDR
jgi:DnaA family protein